MQHNPEEMNSKQKSRDRLSIKPAVDSLHDVKPPLDFTFLCLTSMSGTDLLMLTAVLITYCLQILSFILFQIDVYNLVLFHGGLYH